MSKSLNYEWLMYVHSTLYIVQIDRYNTYMLNVALKNVINVSLVLPVEGERINWLILFPLSNNEIKNVLFDLKLNINVFMVKHSKFY